MIEDKLLIWKLRAGSRDALCRTYEMYKSDLLKLAAGLLNETGAAEDIVHDCFVTLAQSTDKLRLSGNLKGYLAACVANRARNRNKARQRQEAIELAEAGTAASSSKRPEQWIICNERLKLLNNALAQLPYQQREVVVLHAQARMKFKAIAGLQDVSINTVQSRYRYGLDKLRSILDGEAKL